MMKTNIAIAFLRSFFVALPPTRWSPSTGPQSGIRIIRRISSIRLNNPENLRFGSVANTYRISKYEVTNDQYAAFLNAVDPMGNNPNSVYSSSMGSNVRGGIAFNAGAGNGSKYSTKTNMGNKPVNYVTFFDCDAVHQLVGEWSANGWERYRERGLYHRQRSE